MSHVISTSKSLTSTTGISSVAIRPTPPETASLPPPPSLSDVPGDALVNENIRAQLMLLAEKPITNALVALNKPITDPDQTVLRLTDRLTQRMTALEQASLSNLTQAILERLEALEGDRTTQPKKPKLFQYSDAHIAVATPPPPDGDWPLHD